ncbi:MAG: DUF4406 domain-containing protein [Candidatus Treponema excrementipullorum]|uniref:DUF4406 domain-containing protein n=1 Tax=Candidatus Treponema excrementipullorum TaxID=2838768 RepID=A0A9E2L2A2_9SPIR|nr:DUF4406 domain-containing protein [Candidatus Treponema excrementipullorum]
MKIYLAGKITGDPNYREKFAKAEKILASQGHSVMNPACLSEYKEFSWDDYMTVASAMQQVCDATVLLPDWKDSRGARTELKTAESLEQKIFWGVAIEHEFILAPNKGLSMDKLSTDSIDNLRKISLELRKQRMRCSRRCGAWDYINRDCYIFGCNHPAPSRCEYYLGCELARRQNGLQKEKENENEVFACV